jgi:transposase-like protein
MAMNRVQFQRGMSLFELFQQFGTEAQCEAALEHARWPQGFRCPRCGGAAHCVLGVRARKTFQCNTCRHQTSLIAGTVFEGTKLGLTVWFLAMYLISQAKTSLSALALKRDLGVSDPSAWLMHHQLMQAMLEREASYVLCGSVQVDDAYLGGELNGGTAGRGSENKVPFIGAVSLDEEGHPLRAKFTQLTGFTRTAITSVRTALSSPMVWPASPASPMPAVPISLPSSDRANPRTCRCSTGSIPSSAILRPASAVPTTASASTSTPSATSVPLPIASLDASTSMLCPIDCWWRLRSAGRAPLSGFGWLKHIANQEWTCRRKGAQS